LEFKFFHFNLYSYLILDAEMAFLKTLQIGFSVKFIFMRLPCPVIMRLFTLKFEYSKINLEIIFHGLC